MSHDVKYIGMDVRKEAVVIAVLNGSGKLVMETILETKASSIVQFIHGLRGELHVTWEERTWAACLYDLLQPQVEQVVVCNPRRNALLKEGSKSDKVDASKLAELLRTGVLKSLLKIGVSRSEVLNYALEMWVAEVENASCQTSATSRWVEGPHSVCCFSTSRPIE
jgi:hypothetical protein